VRLEPSELVGLKLGNFRLERLLGSGRMGVVYLARDEALLRPTAVKILSWSIPERQGLDPEGWFLAEARNVARINHPHVIQIYGVAKHGPHCYIAMEYVAGTAADVWVNEHGPFSPARATEILLQTAGALQAAHDADVVHRDVKPGNLLITPEGTAKLGDFGMAMSVTAGAVSDTSRAGTPHYTAPEIWSGCFASFATDIYALGATYFYLLTGRPPFEAATPTELMAAHLTARVPDPGSFVADIPSGCSELIQRCMAKTPADRYPSAQALSWEVRRLVRELASLVHAPEASGAGDAPQVGEPLHAIRQTLQAALEDSEVHGVLLLGERGSGKTTLARQLMADYQRSAPVACVSSDEPHRSLWQQASRAFGSVPATVSAANAEIDGLLAELERAHPGRSQPALLVLDNLTPSATRLAEFAVLMQAAAKTGYFRILILATAEVGDGWWTAGGRGQRLGLRRIEMPVLTGRQTLTYIADWLRSAFEPQANRVLITPDAGLLVAYRSGGNLARTNRMIASMLAAAALEGRAVLSSWDAWVAPVDALPPGQPSLAPLVRPLPWPSPEVLEILNAERRSAGIPARHPAGAREKPE